MAIVWGSVVNGYGRIGIDVVTSNPDNVSTKVTVKVYIWSKYSISDTNNTFYFDLGKTAAVTSKGSVSINTSHNSGSGWNSANQQLIATYTHTYTRRQQNQTGYAAAKLTGIDTMGSSNVMSVYTSFSVPARPSYSVTYNANGGTGAPGTQTKWHQVNLVLSTVKPTRTGYTFNGWNTKSDGTGTNYSSGATYTSNAALSLYAKWKAVTYSVTYNANGGTGAPANQTKTHGVNLTLSGTIPIKENYNFLGWSTSVNGNVVYGASGIYKTNAAVTLYAVWALAYYKPVISNLKINRCDSDGTLNDFGTCCKIEFDYDICQLVGENRLLYADYTIFDSLGNQLSNPADLPNAVFNAEKGSYSGIITSYSEMDLLGTDLEFDIEANYIVKLNFTDSKDGTVDKSIVLPPAKFPFDMKSGIGGGVSVGGPAKLEGVFEVYYPIRLSGGMDEIVLYDNPEGEAGTVTLNISVSSFTYIEIYFLDNTGKTGGYTKIYKPGLHLNKPLCLCIQEASRADRAYTRQTRYTMSDFSLVPDIESAGFILFYSGGSSTMTTGTNYLKITRVTGIF